MKEIVIAFPFALSYRDDKGRLVKIPCDEVIIDFGAVGTELPRANVYVSHDWELHPADVARIEEAANEAVLTAFAKTVCSARLRDVVL